MTVSPAQQKTKTQPRLLNLGCGECCHSDWLNIDFHDHGGRVLAYDLRLGIPLPDNAVDVVYHSHILEHFTEKQGRDFIRECHRVLRPGGLMRIAAPDLENIARAYLEALEQAKTGDPEAAERHSWMLIELVDQMVRSSSGGAMAAFWRREPIPGEAFVRSRSGMELENFLRSPARTKKDPPGTSAPLQLPDWDFLMSGELHRWMYDELSLRRLLEAAGFSSIVRQAHNSSASPVVSSYGLDSAADGSVRKPDSFFMEAVKPLSSEKKAFQIAMFAATETGGAGIAAFRLHQALLAAGLSSRMYVARQGVAASGLTLFPAAKSGLEIDQKSGSVKLQGMTLAEQQSGRALSRYPKRPGGLEFFSALNGCAALEKLPFQEDYSLINLHWVAGFFSVPQNQAALRGRPVVWTLHDMRPFTGGCHYAAGCRAFTKNCGSCPQLASDDPKDLSFATWREQMGAYRLLDLHIVTPSEWLAEEARQSSLFKRFPVHVIRYAQALDVFRPLEKPQLRASMGIKPDELVLIFSAMDLNNARKGGACLLEALQLLAAGPLRQHLRLILLGDNPRQAFFELGLRAESVGRINEAEQMARLYNMADAVLVPSLEDNSPNVICESLGCGVPVVAFAAGGIPEMILHERTGWLAPVGDTQSLAAGVAWVHSRRADPSLARHCRTFALEQWNPAERAEEYRELFAGLTDIGEYGKKV